jgi:lysozyme family protein
MDIDAMKFDALKDDYENLWGKMELKPSMAKSCDYGAAKVLSGRTRYEAVSERTGVPWYMIGLIHLMEAGGRFNCHLHNGDPLTAKTVQVPKGRPAKGKAPFAWEDSAVDALVYDGLDKVVDWSLPRIAYSLETFNGWGYRKYHPEVVNPYLWSGSTLYARGKYVRDGKWDATCVSEQVGAMPVLRKLCEMVPEIGFVSSLPTTNRQPVPTTPESFRKASPGPVSAASQRSMTVFGGLIALFGSCVQYLEQAVAVGMDSLAEVTKLEPLKALGPNTKSIGLGLTVAAVALVIGRRLQAAKQGKVG